MPEVPIKTKRWPIQDRKPIELPPGKWVRCPRCGGNVMTIAYIVRGVTIVETSCQQCNRPLDPQRFTAIVRTAYRTPSLFELKEVK